MDKVEIESIIKKYRANPMLFYEKGFEKKLLWYQRLIWKMIIKKDSIIKGFRG